MVRIGEYSPNNRGNRPGIEVASQGTFGFGEYEGKRKYYNEQRKLEYKQYLAQQALKVTSARVSENISRIPTVDKDVFDHCPITDVIPTSGRRDVATQTVFGEQRDASTNTDVASSRESHKHFQSDDHPILHSSTNPYQTIAWNDKKRYAADVKTPQNLPGDGLPGYLRQDSRNGLNFGVKNKNHLDLNAAITSYEQELRAQIEEKKNLSRELERREKQEAESRERWLAEEARRELDRREVEEKRIKALEDLRKQRIEEFHIRSEQLQREAKDRRVKMRDQKGVTNNVIIGPESNHNEKSYSLGEVVSQKTSKYLPNVCDFQSQKSDRSKLNQKQCDDQERHLEPDCIGPEEVLRTAASADGATSKRLHPPFCHSREDDLWCNSKTDKNYTGDNMLSQLGDIRRQLTTQQMKMEEAMKNIRSTDKNE